MARYFPEVVEALSRALPARCVLDGEIVLATGDGLDFDALQLRLHPAESRVKLLSGQTPASFVAFDLLAAGSKDLTKLAFDERRRRLDDLGLGTAGVDPPGDWLAPGRTDVLTTPQILDVDVAARWVAGLEALGLDGVIAKRGDSAYVPGKRVMVKVKHRRTADCIVGGYRLSKSGDGIGSLLLGLYDSEGSLHYVGHTSSFDARTRREMLTAFRPIEGGASFGGGRMPGGPSRWTGKEADWVPLEPVLVCEVEFDHMQGWRFRHAATFQRWRPDKQPAECSLDQVLGSGV